ncbi:hypothetical protein KW794_03330 [Candidatus Saccharibacteria bacterium]|nr:hypothetical protein [Candidatus Saccharibacteria bacterium]
MVERDLSGIWQSHYEYGDGKQSQHQVNLRQDGSEIIGTSLPDPSSSKVTLKLQIDDNVISGVWHERTSPQGHYKGREFGGHLQLILDDEAKKMAGKWIGYNSDKTNINSGKWTLEKIKE